MDTVLNRTGDGWLMIAGVALIYGVPALWGAALIKDLFFAGRSSEAV